eukprot:5872871-Amphidinium_carterae.1
MSWRLNRSEQNAMVLSGYMSLQVHFDSDWFKTDTIASTQRGVVCGFKNKESHNAAPNGKSNNK